MSDYLPVLSLPEHSSEIAISEMSFEQRVVPSV